MNILPLDAESHVVEAPNGCNAQLRLWLRLLTCTALTETDVRTRFRKRFNVTLSRFNLMNQLEHFPNGITLSELSSRLMVSNSNVSGLVASLVRTGMSNDLRLQATAALTS